MSKENNKFNQWKALKAANKHKRYGKANIANNKKGEEKKDFTCIQRLGTGVFAKNTNTNNWSKRVSPLSI